jgi:Concanavalin A-like lectin/glucanases superfamily/CARDB
MKLRELVTAGVMLLLTPLVCFCQLDQGLLAYYAFDGNAKDASGNGNDATPIGSPSYVAGVTGRAIYLNAQQANQQYVLLPYIPLATYSAFSIALWAKIDDTIANHTGGIISFGSQSTVNPGWIEISYNLDSGTSYPNVGFNAGIAGDGFAGMRFPGVCCGSWAHFALIYDNGNLAAFVNGQLVESKSGVVTAQSGTTAALGMVFVNGSPDLHDPNAGLLGAIDDVRVYGRALSAQEISILSQQLPPQSFTGPASSVTPNSETLNGSVNPNGLSTTAYFEWGTNTAYGGTTPATLAGNGTTTLTWNAYLIGLSANTTYHCQLVAYNSRGTNYGGDVSFETLAASGGLVVKGRVLDGASHETLVGASVGLGGQNTTTLSDGSYSFANVSLVAGNTLSVSLAGYIGTSLSVIPPPGATVLTLPDLFLQSIPPTNQPVVTSLNPTYQPVFIAGLPVTDDFTASVNWNGSTPGAVEFYANGQLINSLSGAGPTYTVTLDSSHFNPSLAVGGNTLSVVARNSQGTGSTPSSVFVFDIPYPQTLGLVFQPSQFLSITPSTISVDATWPNPPISTPTLSLPVIGTFGLEFQVNPHFEYDFIDSDWNLGISVVDTNLNLHLGNNNTASGTVSIDGSGHISTVNGFTDTQIDVGLSLTDEFKLGEFGLLDLLGPGISGFVSDIPVIGNAVSDVSIQILAAPQIGGNLSLSFPGFQFTNVEFDGSIAITAEYEPDLYGAGTLKAYVGGTPSITFQVPGQPPGGLLKKAEFKAYAGLEYDVWVFSYSAEFTFLDWTYPSNSQNLIMQPMKTGYWVRTSSPSSGFPHIVARPNVLGGSEGFVANDARATANLTQSSQMSGLEAFRTMGRAAMKLSPFAPRGGGARPRDHGFDLGSLAQVDLTLVTNAFPNNDPALDAFGQELMLLYTTDNGSTNNLNFTDINWTRFDGTNWSAPLSIQTNSQAEIEPQVKYDANGNAIAVWDRVNDPNFNQTNLNAMAADLEIVWSQWNRTNGTWSTPAALTTNNYLDHAPLLCGPLADGSLLLTWTANTSNLLMGTNGAGSQVLWAEWSPASQTWSTPQILITNLPFRLSQSLSGVNNLAVYAWSQDTVGTLTNLPDDQVFYCLWSNGVWSAANEFATNALGNRNARVAVSAVGDVSWVWQQGSNLVMSTNFSLSQTLVRSNSRNAGFSDFAMTFGPANNLFLLWQDMTTNGSHAHYSVYDPVSATWSHDEVLRSDPPLERSLAPVWDSAGNLTVAYDVVNLVTNNISVTLTNGTVVIVTNVPQPGRVDVAVTKRVLIEDLALLPGDSIVSGNNYLPGDTVTLTANVRNLGDLGISNIVVSFYDGNPNLAGILISNVTLAGWLSGAATNGLATALWVVPAPATNHVVYAVVNQTNAANEFNPTNNTQSVSIGGTDLAVSLVSYSAQTNGAVRVIAQVQNLGAPGATNSILAIRFSGQTGAPLTTAPVPALNPGELAQVALDLPPGTQPPGEQFYQLTADDTHVVADVNTNNNETACSVFLWVDSDGDGIPDSWMIEYFGHPTGLASDNSLARDSASGDGISNLQKYLTGQNPLVWNNLHIIGGQYLTNGTFQLTVFGQIGHNYSLLASSNCATWTPILSFACTNGTMNIVDTNAGNYAARFYRLVTPPVVPPISLKVGPGRQPGTNELDLDLSATVGLEYRIDAASDLINWMSLTNFISMNATMSVCDVNVTNFSLRFYRTAVT